MDTSNPLEHLRPKLLKRARRLGGRSHDAEDLAQDTLLRLYQVMQSDQIIDAPEHYAMTLLRNLAAERWRRRRQTEEVTDEMLQAPPLAPARMACAEVQAAIGRLPPDQAALMRLVMSGETSPAVLARKLDLPKGTVMSRLSRARHRLRSEMNIEGSVTELL